MAEESSKSQWVSITTELTQAEFEQLEILALYNSTTVDKYVRGVVRLHLNEKRAFINSVKERIQKKVAKAREKERLEALNIPKEEDFEHKNDEFRKSGKSLFDRTVVSTNEEEQRSVTLVEDNTIKKVKLPKDYANELKENKSSEPETPKVEAKILNNPFFNRVIPGKKD